MIQVVAGELHLVPRVFPPGLLQFGEMELRAVLHSAVAIAASEARQKEEKDGLCCWEEYFLLRVCTL